MGIAVLWYTMQTAVRWVLDMLSLQIYRDSERSDDGAAWLDSTGAYRLCVGELLYMQSKHDAGVCRWEQGPVVLTSYIRENNVYYLE